MKRFDQFMRRIGGFVKRFAVQMERNDRFVRRSDSFTERLVVPFLFVLALVGDYLLGNWDRAIRVCEPISLTAVLVSLAISAATTAGSMLLTRLLTPKPQANELGRMQGQLQLADSSWKVMKPEIYGGPLDDGIGGCQIGINIIWMNKEGVRETRTTVPSSTGGGGKGPPKPPPDIKVSYDCDLACLVGSGPLEVLRIKFNDDVAYQVATVGTGFENRQYEAEDQLNNTYSGGASQVNSSICSGGKKINLPQNDYVQFGSVRADSNDEFDLTIYYINDSDTSLDVSVNGGTAINVLLPDSNNEVGVVTINSVAVPIATNNTIRLTNLSAATIGIDRIFIIVVPDLVPPGPGPDDFDNPYRRYRNRGVTGMLDPYFPADSGYDPFLLPDPYLRDPNPLLRHSAIAPAASADNSIVTNINAGFYGELVIYEGNDDQEPDPVIAADVDGQYGTGSTPAYLGDCYFRISKLNLSKYNGFPNIVVTARNKIYNTIEDILVLRAKKVGLTDDDLDLTATSATPCRGYVIASQESPKETMEAFAAAYNFDFVETSDGIVEAVDLTDRTIVDDISEDELGAFVKGESDEQVGDLVVTQVPDESEMWKYVKVGFFNPEMDFQDDERQDVYPQTTSERTQSFSWNMTLLKDEAFWMARRLMQMHWAGALPDAITLPDSRIWLNASNRIRIPINGQLRTRRIREIQGTFPGVLRTALVPDELSVFASPGLVPARLYRPVNVPANTITTFLDIKLLHPEALPGLYIACRSRDVTSGVWAGATAYRFKGGDWQQKTTFTAQATIGRAVGVLPDVPSDWADARNNFIRFAYGGADNGGNGTPATAHGALAREPDADGELNPWSERLRRESAWEVGKALGRHLFLGTEYLNRNRTNDEYVHDLYSSYLDRDPDATGYADYMALLAGGTPRETLLFGFGFSEEFITRCETAAATFFDTDSEITVDIFGQDEPSTITDDQAREGNGLWVFGNEACIVVNWTRDNDFPNRWVGSRMIRRLRGTDAASDDHVDGERVVLMNSALRFVEMDVTDQGVEQEWRVVTAAARLEDAATLRVTWNGESIVDPNDPHVPTIGDAPTITKDDSAAIWIVYTPRPKAYAMTLVALEIALYSDSGGTALLRTVPGSSSGRTLLSQTVADGYFRYRWRNQSAEDIGNGRGWSNWSPVSAIAYGSGNATQPPGDTTVPPPPIDPYDSGDPDRGDQPRREYTIAN